LKYNCDNCKKVIDVNAELETEYEGEKCSMLEYIIKTKNNPSVLICCDDCIAKMSDAGHFFESGDYIAINLN